MKFLLVSGIYRPEIGGPATYVPSLANQLLQKDNKVTVVTLKNSQAAKTAEPWDIKYINRDQIILVRFFKTLVAIFRNSISSDYVFANGLYQETSLSLLFLKKRSVAKIVGDPVWERATNRSETTLEINEFNKSNLKLKYKLQRIFLRWSLNRFTSITCPSEELVEIVKSWGVTKPITYIPNGVKQVISRGHSKQFDLITVCRLVKWKNLDKLITANAELKTKLVIVGSGPEEAKLMALAKQTKSDVTFSGLLPEELVLEYLCKSKIFVLISSYEGLSFSLLQAMACGLPSIVSNIQGNKEVIESEKEGVVIDINEEGSLIEAVNLLLGDSMKRSLLGKNSLFKVATKYSQEIQVEKVVSQLTDGVSI
jgi:glycosyltransferase involved in cell wall biosynthesis